MQDLPKSINMTLYIVAQKYDWQSEFSVHVFDYMPTRSKDVINILLCETQLSMDIPESKHSELVIDMLTEQKESVLRDAESKVKNIDEKIKFLLPKSEE